MTTKLITLTTLAAYGNTKPLAAYVLPVVFANPNNFERVLNLAHLRLGLPRDVTIETIKELMRVNN